MSWLQMYMVEAAGGLEDRTPAPLMLVFSLTADFLILIMLQKTRIAQVSPDRKRQFIFLCRTHDLA